MNQLIIWLRCLIRACLLSSGLLFSLCGNTHGEQLIQVKHWKCTEIECASQLASSVIYPEEGWYEIRKEGRSYWVMISDSNANAFIQDETLLPMSQASDGYELLKTTKFASFILDLSSDYKSSELDIAGLAFDMGIRVNNDWWIVSKDNPALVLTTSELSFLPIERVSAEGVVGVSENRLLYLDAKAQLIKNNASVYNSRLRLIKKGGHLWLYEEGLDVWSLLSEQGFQLLSRGSLPLYDSISGDEVWTFQQVNTFDRLNIFAKPDIQDSIVVPLDKKDKLQTLISIPVTLQNERRFLVVGSNGEKSQLIIQMDDLNPALWQVEYSFLEGESLVAGYLKSMLLAVPSNVFKFTESQLWGLIAGYSADGEIQIEVVNVSSDRVESKNLSHLLSFTEHLKAVTELTVRNGMVKVEVIEQTISQEYLQKVYFINLLQVAHVLIDSDLLPFNSLTEKPIEGGLVTPISGSSLSQCTYCEDFEQAQGVYATRLWSWRLK